MEVQGFRFPDALTALDAAALEEVRPDGPAVRLPQTALKVARTRDCILVLGGGSGLLPVLLAGRLGVRHLTVVEPDAQRRKYLNRVMEANGLVRVTVANALPEPLQPTLIVADLSRASARLPDDLPDKIRGAVFRLPEGCERVAALFDQMAARGLSYFPRQSARDVVTFLSKWR
jgi:hypothetical protein